VKSKGRKNQLRREMRKGDRAFLLQGEIENFSRAILVFFVLNKERKIRNIFYRIHLSF